MKNQLMKLRWLGAMFLIACSPVAIAESTTNFLTFGPTGNSLTGKIPVVESISHELDPEGNWSSTPRAGIIVSFRLNKPTFEAGEPIMASILIRNLSTQTVFYPSELGSVPVTYFITEGIQSSLPLSTPELGWGSAKLIELKSGTQRKYSDRLDKKYALTNLGSYSLSVVLRFMHQATQWEVSSGSALISIVPSLGTGTDRDSETPSANVVSNKGRFSKEKIRHVILDNEVHVPTNGSELNSNSALASTPVSAPTPNISDASIVPQTTANTNVSARSSNHEDNYKSNLMFGALLSGVVVIAALVFWWLRHIRTTRS